MLVRLGDGEHALLAVMHHIVSDAWSLDVMLREAMAVPLRLTGSAASVVKSCGTICAALGVCAPEPGRPPLGRAIANVEVYVLGPDGWPAPMGATGELHVGGAGVGRGYGGEPAHIARKL
ncbi:MAG: AMP-binding protein [Acidobacteria bacterium]|nr:AMP-binding protein [Acidobacteriota bacterium]